MLTSRSGRRDSLDVLEAEAAQLRRIFDAYHSDGEVRPERAGRVSIEEAYERGTLIKLAVEHGAIYLAAARDVVCGLRRSGKRSLAERLDRKAGRFCDSLDCLEEVSRGVQPVTLGSSSAAAEYMLRLASEVVVGHPPVARVVAESRSALERRGCRLHSEHYVRRHAPVHPVGTTSSWMRLRPVLWVRARYDRLRGFPWAENRPFGDPQIDRRYGVNSPPATPNRAAEAAASLPGAGSDP